MINSSLESKFQIFENILYRHSISEETIDMNKKIIDQINSNIIDYRTTIRDISKSNESDESDELNKNKIDSKRDKSNSQNSQNSDIENMDEISKIYDNFKLRERVVAFFDGRDWNVISLDFMLRHPIFLYKHWSDKDQIYYDNSLLVCPMTLRAMIYKGKIKIEDIINNYELIIRNEDTDDIFPMSNPYTGHYDVTGIEKKIKSHVKRIEVKILEHRDMFAFDADPRYITLESKAEYINSQYINSKYNTESDYLENRLGVMGDELTTIFHPKSLVYVVQYYSETDKSYRHLILISPNMSKDKIVGYRYKFEKFWSYVEQNKEKLIEKRAFTYPMLWFTIEKIQLSNYDVLVIPN